MNRNIKKIVALALTINAVSAIVPAANLSSFTINAYAASGDLTSIKLKDSDSGTIKTYSEDDYKSKNQVDDDEMDENETYYAKTSSKSIKITAKGVSSSHVRVFKGKNSSTKGLKTSSTIELSPDSTATLTIRTYAEDPGTVKYNDDSYVSQYIIKVQCTAGSSDSSGNSVEENGDVYLKSLYLSDSELSFSKSISTYNTNVAESVSETKITAKPDCDSSDYDNYTVTIDGTTVDQEDKFKETVSLNKGKNEIKITVEDNNDEKRTYTLNITRGQETDANTGNNAAGAGNTSNGGNSGVIPAVSLKPNQWAMINGKWQYNDSTGKPVKSIWFFDRNYGKNYYLQEDGNMSTGWLLKDGNWYYLGDDGSMKNGWQLVGGTWYYLNPQGVMAYNTVIDGYKLNASGAWIK